MRTVHLLGTLSLTALVICVPLVIFPNHDSIPEHAKVSVLLLLTGLSCACAIISRNRTRTEWPRVTVAVALTWLGLLLISTLLSSSMDRSLFGIHYRYNGFLLQFTYASLCVATVFYIRHNKNLARVLISAFVIVACVQVALGLTQYAGYHPFNPHSTGERIRPTGTLSFANLYSGVLCLALILTTGMFLHHKKRTLTALLFLTIAGIAICLRIGSSRGCWLVAGVGCLMVILFAWWNASSPQQRRGTLLRAHAVGLALVLAFVLFPLERFIPGMDAVTKWRPVSADLQTFLSLDASERLGSALNTNDLTRVARMELWGAALTIWQENPLFGTGPDTFAYAYQGLRTPENVRIFGQDSVAHDAHNIVLHNMATWGALPTLAWLAFHGCVAFAWLQNLRLANPDNRLLLFTLGVAYVGGYGLQLLVVGSITQNMLLFILAGILLGWTPSLPELPYQPSTRRTIAGVLVLALLIPVSIIPVAVERAFISAGRQVSLGQTDSAIEAYRRVLERFPWREEYWERSIALWMVVGTTEKDIALMTEAETMLDEAIARFPLQSRLHALRGRYFSMQADRIGDDASVEKALRSFEAATVLHPVQPQYHGWRGEMAERLQRWQTAREAYTLAIELGNEEQQRFYRTRLDRINQSNASIQSESDE